MKKMKKNMKKKEYINPEMTVVKIQHQCQLLAGSNNAKSLSTTDGIGWDVDGLNDGEDDV